VGATEGIVVGRFAEGAEDGAVDGRVVDGDKVGD